MSQKYRPPSPPPPAEKEGKKETFWKAFIKDIKPLKNVEDKLPPSLPPLPKVKAQRDHIALTLEDLPFTSQLEKERCSPLRRRQQRRLSAEATLDLHGFTQQEALPQLVRFIEESYQKRLRCILIITGKGRPSPGILRQMTLAALADPRLKPMISRYTEASPKDGGTGALFVLLKA